MAGTLYGSLMSPNVARAKLVANELGLQLEFKYVNLSTGEHKKEDFLAINPFGTVPAFVSPDGVTLFESRAIGKYLDFKNGGKLTHTHDAKLYGLVENWAYVEETQWTKYIFTIIMELFFKPVVRKIPTDQGNLDTAKAALKNNIAVYEKHLATTKSTYITGNELSIADLFHVPVIATIVSGPLPLVPDLLVPYPHVKAWIDRLLALPSWQTIAKEQAEVFAKTFSSK